MANPTGYRFGIQNSDGTTTMTNVLYASSSPSADGSGAITSFGRNLYGQLGDGTIVDKSSPIIIGSLINWKQVSPGLAFTIAIKTDGTLWAWGYNAYGELGNGTVNIYYSSPIQVGSLSNWSSITSGQRSSMAIKTDGTLWVWGGNNYGQLGNGTTVNYSSPIQIGSLTTWSKVSCGYYSVAAIKTDGTLWTWGHDAYGQLGNGTTVNYSSPIQIGSLTNWSSISVGFDHMQSIKTDGTLWTWGYNQYGQIGNGTVNAYYSSPIQIGSLTNWSKISSGIYISAAIKTDGTLWTWGYNSFGSLANGNTTNYSSPIQVGSLTSWSKVACGYASAAIKTDGTLWTWGRNNYGQLGNGTTASYSSPIQIGSLTNWSSISASKNFYTVGIQSFNAVPQPATLVDMADMFVGKDSWYNAGLWGWGYDAYGVIGNGTTAHYSSPIQVGSLTNWKQVSTEGSSSYGIKVDGTLWAWGYGGIYGTLGNSTLTSTSSPVQVGLLTNWKQISGGSLTASAIKTDGTLWTWGFSQGGQLGNGTGGPTAYYSSPVQVGSLTNWKQVSTAYTHVAAVKTDGTLWTWGVNNVGQLGNGTTVYYSSPIQVGSLTNWKQVFAGGASGTTAAIKNDGTLWAWGQNSNGQLGNGTTVRYSSPIQIGSLTNWKQVSIGETHLAAVKTDGTLWTWGYNNYGQLGTNSSGDQYSSPVQIGALTNWKQVACGTNETHGIKTDGTLWGWGTGSYGPIGNGTTDSYSSPIQVGLLTIWKQISGGTQRALAIQAPDYQLPQYVPGAPTGLSV